MLARHRNSSSEAASRDLRCEIFKWRWDETELGESAHRCRMRSSLGRSLWGARPRTVIQFIFLHESRQSRQSPLYFCFMSFSARNSWVLDVPRSFLVAGPSMKLSFFQLGVEQFRQFRDWNRFGSSWAVVTADRVRRSTWNGCSANWKDLQGVSEWHGTWRENNGKHWICKLLWWRMLKSWKVYVDGWEDRDDCTVVDVGNLDSEVIETMKDWEFNAISAPREVPSECIGYVTGARRAALGNMEEERFSKLQKTSTERFGRISSTWKNMILWRPSLLKDNLDFGKIVRSCKIQTTMFRSIYFGPDIFQGVGNPHVLHEQRSDAWRKGRAAFQKKKEVGRFQPDLNLNPTSTPLNLSMLLTHSNTWRTLQRATHTHMLNHRCAHAQQFDSVLYNYLDFFVLFNAIQALNFLVKHGVKRHQTSWINMNQHAGPWPRAKSRWLGAVGHLRRSAVPAWRRAEGKFEASIFFRKLYEIGTNCDKLWNYWILTCDWILIDFEIGMVWIGELIGLNMIAPSSDHVLSKKIDLISNFCDARCGRSRRMYRSQITCESQLMVLMDRFGIRIDAFDYQLSKGERFLASFEALAAFVTLLFLTFLSFSTLSFSAIFISSFFLWLESLEYFWVRYRCFHVPVETSYFCRSWVPWRRRTREHLRGASVRSSAPWGSLELQISESW